jgi:hypothetical protein
MIPRGEVGLVFAAIGAASGTLDKTVASCDRYYGDFDNLLAPPLLRFAFKQSPRRKRVFRKSQFNRLVPGWAKSTHSKNSKVYA